MNIRRYQHGRFRICSLLARNALSISISISISTVIIVNLVFDSVIGSSPSDSSSSSNFERSDLVDTTDFYTLLMNDVFVDKSMMIESLIKRKQLVTRIARPSKWGKTTNMDMIKRFFQVEVNERGERIKNADERVNRKLFLGGTVKLADGRTKTLAPLKIAGAEEVIGHLGEHPVISVNFKSVTADTPENAAKNLNRLLMDQFLEHSYVNDSLNALEKELYAGYVSGSKLANETSVKNSLKFLSEMLFKHFRRGVYILIDDYHRPVFDYFYRRVLEQRTENPALTDAEIYFAAANVQEMHKIVSAIEGILHGCLEVNNPALYQALLTEVYDLDLTGALYDRLQIGRTYTFTDSAYIDAYGFTEDEMVDLLRKVTYVKQTDLDRIRAWYGFNFTDTEVYNPYSIRRFFAEKGRFDVYWSTITTAAGQPEDDATVIDDVLSSNPIQEDLQHFIEGRKLVCEAAHSKVDFFSFPTNIKGLLQAGYLSVATTFRMTLQVYKPNLEIERIMKAYLIRWMRYKFQLNRNTLENMADTLAAFDVDQLQKQLRAILPAIPDDSFEAEVCYSGIVKGLVYSLDRHYDTAHNVETEWKPNVLLISKPDDDDDNRRDKNAIIIHYKVVGVSREIEEKGKLALQRMNGKLKNINLKKYKWVNRVLKLVLVFCRDLLGVQYQIDDNK